MSTSASAERDDRIPHHPGHSVRINLLGPLTVTVAGEVMPLGPLKQRTLLAILFCRKGVAVPPEVLIDALWAGDPPASAASNVRQYVHALRRALGRDAISGSGRPGYRLDLDLVSTDVAEFDRLCATAEAAAGRHDFVAARDRLAEAVALRRDRAFADVGDLPLIADEVRSVEERWLLAKQRFFDAELRLGRAAESVGELSSLTTHHPYQERFWVQLMLALYRAQRQSEALEAYQRARRVLHDELGLEPGLELQTMQRRILDADPGLSDDPPKPVPPAAPAQLPPDLPAFVGRRAELDRLAAAAGRPLIVISGTAGVGKTTLAVHWAATVADRFPDGILHVNLRGYEPGGTATTPAEAVRGFLDAFDVPPQGIPVTATAQLSLYRRLVAGKRVLVLLDNARDPDQVRPLLPNSPGCLAVVTSRHRLPALVVTDGAYLLPVDLLSVSESRQLLAARLGAGQVAAEPQPVAEIIDRCARLPLAMTLITTRATAQGRFTLAALADELRATEGRLDVLSSVDRSIDVRTVFSWSYDGLTPAAASLFGLIGLHCGPDITAPAAAALLGVPPRRANELLAELTDAHLVVEHAEGRFGAHDLLRAYATERLAGDTAEPLRRIFDYYLHSAYAAEGLIYPHRDETDLDPPCDGVTPQTFTTDRAAAAWLTAERVTLLAAVDQALASGFPAHAFHLALALVTFLGRRGYWDDEVTVLHQALNAARQMDDPLGPGHATRLLGAAYAHLGHYDRAATLAREALTLFENHADRIGRARAHRDLAMLHWRRGQSSEALHHIHQVLHLSTSAGLRAGPAFALYLFACVHFLNGDRSRAVMVCRIAIAAYREIGDRIGEAVAWEGCGLAYTEMGRTQSALDCHERALSLRRETGERLLAANSLLLIGDTQARASRPDRARVAWQAAYEILSELGHPDVERAIRGLEQVELCEKCATAS